MQSSPKEKLIQCVNDLMPYRGLIGSSELPKELTLLTKDLHTKGNHRELIQQMKIFFRINCNLGLGFSPSIKNPKFAMQDAIMKSMRSSFDLDFFFQAADIDPEKRKTPASISFPMPTPAFNSRAFETMPINMIVERWVFMLPLETILFLVSHELSHILLHATQSRYRNNEVATDILAIILIGPDIAKRGIGDFDFRVGYIKEEQFKIVHNKIREESPISRLSGIKKHAMNFFRNF